MSDWKTIRKVQELFNLNEYEAKAFAALVRKGTGVVPLKLSILSEIPRARIYDVCYGLEKKGLISVIPRKGKRPTQLKARPKEEIIELTKRKNEERMRRLSKGIQWLYVKVGSKKNAKKI